MFSNQVLEIYNVGAVSLPIRQFSTLRLNQQTNRGYLPGIASSLNGCSSVLLPLIQANSDCVDSCTLLRIFDPLIEMMTTMTSLILVWTVDG